jgi:hypothetical protein
MEDGFQIVAHTAGEDLATVFCTPDDVVVQVIH